MCIIIAIVIVEVLNVIMLLHREQFYIDGQVRFGFAVAVAAAVDSDDDNVDKYFNNNSNENSNVHNYVLWLRC